MQYDFSRIEDIDSFISIPEGRYTCRVAEVREGVSRDGSARWSLRLEVALGEYAGRTAAWDSVTWSERGIRRVKHVLEALGLDVSGQVEITPGDLLSREVVASFQSEEREDAFTGRRVLRLRVPYAGYNASPAGALRAHGEGTANGEGGASGDGRANGHGSLGGHGPSGGSQPTDSTHAGNKDRMAPTSGHGGRAASNGFDDEFEG